MIQTLLTTLLLVPVFSVLGIVIGLLYKGIDRRLAARMQARIGPPIRQPFIDVDKLMMKETIVPKNAVSWLFNLMPVVALVSSLALLLYVPFMGLQPLLGAYGDLIVILYLLIFPSLALVIGGFASSSPYATVGAQREMVAMISYEFPLAITIIAIAWLMSMVGSGPAAAFDILHISMNPVWQFVGPIGSLGLVLLFVVLLFVTTGELGAIPVDAAEAETEIAGGLLAEYSGRNLALFYMANAVKMVVLGSIIIALFLPMNITEYFGIYGYTLFTMTANALFFLLKLFVVVFLSSTFIRIAIARFRITQVVKVYWGYTTFAALLGFLLIGVDIFLKVM